MRKVVARVAGATGVRSTFATGRDRFVDLLNGDGRCPVVRRNERDDRHLKLLLRFCLRPASNCLDIGANRGMFLREICRLAPDGQHIAYEPISRLAQNLGAQFPGVDVRQRALSDTNGHATFVEFLDRGFVSESGLIDQLNPAVLRASRHTTSTMTTERFDDHVPSGWLPDFVKIDVEGAELQVLEGAIDTLRKARPVVAFEHGRLHDNSEHVFELLHEDAGLRLFTMDGEGPLSRDAFLEQLQTRWNWVAHE